MRNLGCLILAILLSPIVLILIGPLLVVAAVRGRQPVGAIMLNTAQYGPAGRLGALMLGLGLWLLVWGGLIWVVSNGLLPNSPPAVETTPAIASPFPVEQPAVAATESDPAPTSPPDIVSAPTSTQTAGPTPTATPAAPTATPTVLVVLDLSTPVTSTSTLTPTIITPTETPVPTVIVIDTPVITAVQSDTLVINSPTSTLSITDTQTVINTVEEANVLLREISPIATEDNLARLAGAWQGRALEKAQNFAAELYSRYAKPFDVEFKYLAVPSIKRVTPDEVTVVSREVWTYGGLSEINQESFEFTYVLSRKNEGWAITYYSYLNLPQAAGTPAETVIPTGTAPSP